MRTWLPTVPAAMYLPQPHRVQLVVRSLRRPDRMPWFARPPAWHHLAHPRMIQ